MGNVALTVPGSPREPDTQGSGKIEGVISTPEGHPVAYALVNVVGQQNGVARKGRSNALGHFSFTDLPPGKYKIHVAQKAFERLTQVIEVNAGEAIQLSLTLALAPLTETITVTATRSEQRLGDLPNQVSVVTREDISRSAALTVDDLLRQVPSFSLFRRTSSLVAHPTTQGVSLRGIGASGVSRTLVMLDGIPHNDPFGNWVYWSKIPKLQIETIEVAEGGLSNLYGSSAMAGVINVITKRPERRTIMIKGQGGTRGTGDLGLFGSHELGRVGVVGGGNFFRTGGYKLVQEEERGPIDTPFASRHKTFNWRLDYSPTANVTFYQNARFFHEDRDNGTPLRENSTSETYLGGGLHAFTSDGSNWRVNFFSHFQTFKSSFTAVAADRVSESLALLQEVPAKDFGMNAQWFRRFGDTHLITVGADTRWIKGENEEDVFIPRGPLAGLNIRDRFIEGQQTYTGIYFQDFVTPMPRLNFVLGARIDYWKNFDASRTEILNTTQATTITHFPNRAETTVTPRAGIAFHLTDHFTLRGSFYQGFRAPTLNELYRPFRVGNVQTNANEQLVAERLTGAEGGFNYVLAKNLFWRLTGFWNRLKDPVSNVTLFASENLITRQRQNLGRSRIRGIDTEIVYHLNTLWRIRGHYLFDQATIEDFPARPEIVGNRIPQVPKHRASLGLNYLNPAWTNVSLQCRFESLRFDDDLNQLELGSFFVTDLTASRRLAGPWEAFLSVENLFNRRYAVQKTPVGLLGTPLLVSAGVRFWISPW